MLLYYFTLRTRPANKLTNYLVNLVNIIDGYSDMNVKSGLLKCFTTDDWSANEAQLVEYKYKWTFILRTSHGKRHTSTRLKHIVCNVCWNLRATSALSISSNWWIHLFIDEFWKDFQLFSFDKFINRNFVYQRSFYSKLPNSFSQQCTESVEDNWIECPQKYNKSRKKQTGRLKNLSKRYLKQNPTENSVKTKVARKFVYSFWLMALNRYKHKRIGWIFITYS